MLEKIKRMLQPGINKLSRRIKDTVLPFEQQVHNDMFPRPHFAYGTYFAALQAKALGHDAISVYEFGVGWGFGLLELEKTASLVQKETGIRVDVFGFDTGSGMPQPIDYRDLPHVWKPGFFHLDVAALESKLHSAKLVIGNVKDTVPEFLSTTKPAPIGFVSIDVDYYSSTLDVLKLFDSSEKHLLPRIYCYFDDIVGDDWEVHCEFIGELLAIKEFNDAHPMRKIAKINCFRAKKQHWAPWNEQMYVLHTFDHPDYCRYINPKPLWDTHRLGSA